MIETETKLLGCKPCPFCGLKDERNNRLFNFRVLHTDNGYFFVECYGCAAHGPYTENPDEAIPLWNARIDVKLPPDYVEQEHQSEYDEDHKHV